MSHCDYWLQTSITFGIFRIFQKFLPENVSKKYIHNNCKKDGFSGKMVWICVERNMTDGRKEY